MPLAVCATPIGNLGDVTLRVLEELAPAETVLCEDTRHTRVLLERHGIRARLLSYHQHNEASRVAELVPRLVAGERIALVSDAGLPGVNDPGARIVAAALAAGVVGDRAPRAVRRRDGARREWARRRAVPLRRLPSARRAGSRCALARARARGLIRPWRSSPPRRLPASLASLAAAEPERLVAVCRELTKAFEEVVTGPAAVVAERYSEAPRGEVTLVIGPSTRVADAGLLAPPSSSSSRPARPGDRRHRRRPADRRSPKHAVRDLSVIIFDNVDLLSLLCLMSCLNW